MCLPFLSCAPFSSDFFQLFLLIRLLPYFYPSFPYLHQNRPQISYLLPFMRYSLFAKRILFEKRTRILPFHSPTKKFTNDQCPYASYLLWTSNFFLSYLLSFFITFLSPKILYKYYASPSSKLQPFLIKIVKISPLINLLHAPIRQYFLWFLFYTYISILI